MALFRRERTGQGDHVDVSLYEPLMFIVGDMIMNYTGTGFVQGRVGNGTGSASPRGVYQAADGKWLAIAASNQGIAKRLFAAMGQAELIENPRYATNEVRMQHNEELQALVKGWVAERPRDEILKVLDEYEVVCSQVNDASDIVEDPHFLDRTLVALTGVEALGRVLMPGPVLKFEGGADPVYDGVPSIGEHTDEVLTDLLSLTDAEIGALAEAGTVRSARVRLP
jgi:crotonobetainyl-CoA:carnitine CoA-transferase CaiB-like acyl-CoA transferase